MGYYDYLKSKYAMDADDTTRRHRNGTPCHAKSEGTCPEHRKDAKKDEVDDVRPSESEIDDGSDGLAASVAKWMARPATERAAAHLALRSKIADARKKFPTAEIDLSEPDDDGGIVSRMIRIHSTEFLDGAYVDGADFLDECIENLGIPFVDLDTDHDGETSYICVIESAKGF